MSYSVQRLLEVAEAEVGYQEKASNNYLDDKKANAGSSNWTKYARDLNNAGYYNGNKNGYAWCDVFVDWCHYMAANKDASEAQRVTFQTGPLGAGCHYSMWYYRDAERWYIAPKRGDQIFFEWSGNKSTSDHTGIVYDVDATYVYTIEGNTNAYDPKEGNGDGVYHKKHELNSYYIVGYGRPVFDEIYDESDTYTPNSDAIQSATKHNFFNISMKSISTTEASIKISTYSNSNYQWSYQLVDLKHNKEFELKKLTTSGLTSLNLTNLAPHTPYVLKVIASNAVIQSSKQILFSTMQDVPNNVTNLTVEYNGSVLTEKKCKITFNKPSTWSSYEVYKNKGYRVSIAINGKIAAHSDALIINTSDQTITKELVLQDFLKSTAGLSLRHGDTLQIGIQTWIKTEDNHIILNSANPLYSPPIYLNYHTGLVNKLYLKILDSFKHIILWHNT